MTVLGIGIVHCLSNALAVIESQWTFLPNKFQESWESNLGWLSEERERYFCAMPTVDSDWNQYQIFPNFEFPKNLAGQVKVDGE